MPILVECHVCGKTLRAPDHAAGKSSFCPGCGASVEIPAESASPAVPEIRPARLEPADDYAPPGTGPETGSRFQECPGCGHEISRSAVACPNCGEKFAHRRRKSRSAQTQEHTLGMLCHLLVFLTFVGVPLGNIFGPLVLWMVKKDESEFVDHHGRESLNFQISLFLVLLGGVVGVFLFSALIGFAGGEGLAAVPVFLGFLAGIVASIGGLINVVIAAIRANNGEYYEYPFSFRLIPRSRPR